MQAIEIEFAHDELVRRYDDLFHSCSNAFIQQSTDWCRVITSLGPDKPIFLICNSDGDDVAGLPLYLYENEHGNILTSVPQPGALGGVFFRDDLPKDRLAPVYQCLLEKATAIAQRHECITLTIITSPFRSDLALYEQYLRPDYVLENFTQTVPVQSVIRDGAIVLPDRRGNLRRNLKKARANGFQIRPCTSHDDFQKWYDIHVTRHSELGAKPLEHGLLKNMFEQLVPKDSAILFLAEHEGTIVAGCFFVYHKNVMDVFMLSAGAHEASQGTNYLLVDHSLHWASQRRIRLYNWQSSESRSSGVYNFKKQWGSEENQYYFVTKLFCEHQHLAQIGEDGLKRYYPWHYVVPFGVFDGKFHQNMFSKI